MKTILLSALLLLPCAAKAGTTLRGQDMSLASYSTSGTTITLTAYTPLSGFQHNLISSQTALGYSELAWSGLSSFSSSTTWTFSCDGSLPSANGRVFITVNGDWTQANYDYVNHLVNSAGTNGTQGTVGLNKWCLLTNNGVLLAAGGQFHVSGTFRPDTGNTKSVTFQYEASDVQSGGVRDKVTGGRCTYTGTAVVNTVQMFFWDPANTGTLQFRGTCKLGVMD